MKPILFGEERVQQNGIGTIQINRPQNLNALNSECYLLLEHKLADWSNNPNIAAVVVTATGDKAFCAGGDVKTLAVETKKQGLSYAKSFFTLEYFVDYYLYQYPKPIIALADGITMGGGLGLLNGCSHRIVTERTTMAMPEVAIGLFPDVGATGFLSKLNNSFGLFLGLTGCRFSGITALSAGLADRYVPSQKKRQLLTDLVRLPWRSEPHANHALLNEYLEQTWREKPASKEHQEYLEHSTNLNNDYYKTHQFLSELKTESPFLKAAQKIMLEGSPLSKQVFFAAYQKHRDLNIREVFIREWEMAIRFMQESEFYEGVRAVLIDKDKSPKWSRELLMKYQNDKNHFFQSGDASDQAIDHQNELAVKFLQVGL